MLINFFAVNVLGLLGVNGNGLMQLKMAATVGAPFAKPINFQQDILPSPPVKIISSKSPCVQVWVHFAHFLPSRGLLRFGKKERS